MQGNIAKKSTDKAHKYSFLQPAIVLLIAISFLFGFVRLVSAATTTVLLGAADDFALLAGSTITNTGSSVITGDLGLSPGTSVVGFPPGTVSGTQHITDATAAQAQIDLITAYNDAAGRTPVSTVPAELGGTTKTDGVYTSETAVFGITGTLTLDGQGDLDSVFIFKTTETLTTATASSIELINGAQACHVFWEIGSSATLGSNSVFMGNILALTSVTINTGADVTGRVLTRNAAITLDTNTVTLPICLAATPTPTATPTATATATPTVTPPATASPTVTPTITLDPSSLPDVLAVTSGRKESQQSPMRMVVLFLLAGISTFSQYLSANKRTPQTN